MLASDQLPGVKLTTLSAWNSATALNTTQTIFSGQGIEAVLVQLVQTTTLTAGAITFEATFDGTNWITVPASQVIDPASAAYAQISLPYTVQASTNKPFLISSNGWQGLRIKLSTQITGTGAVTPNYALLAYDPATSVIAFSPTAANFLATATQGGAAALSGAWPIKLTDGTNTMPTMDTAARKGFQALTDGTNTAAVKAASTAAAAADPAVVVAISPNNTVPVATKPATSGGFSTYHVTSAATTNLASIKGSAGQVFGWYIYNSNAAARKVVLHNVSGTPTAGATVTLPIVIPASSAANVFTETGIAFGTGIGISTVTGLADSDTAAVALNDLIINIFYA